MARTTLDLDDALIDEALRETGEATKTAVIERGLRALIAAKKRERLVAFLKENSGQPLEGEPPRRRRAE